MNKVESSLQTTSNQELVEILSGYFLQRGSFLAQVIKADIKSSLNYGECTHREKKHDGKTIASYNNHLELKSSSDKGASQNIPHLNTQNQAVEDLIRTDNLPIHENKSIAIEKFLIEQVVQRTGFPSDSITLESRLLDDLNMDSIKGGDLIATVAAEYGVANQIDPSTLANATLLEIVEALRSVLPKSTSPKSDDLPIVQSKEVANSKSVHSDFQIEKSIPNLLMELVEQRTGFPKESLSMDMYLLDDLNLDSIKTAELVAEVAKNFGVENQLDPANFANATLTEIANALKPLIEETNLAKTPESKKLESYSANPKTQTVTPTIMAKEEIPWVRDFVVEYVFEEASIISEDSQEENWETANIFPIDNWQVANILMVCEREDIQLAEEFSQDLKTLGASVQITTFFEVRKQNLLSDSQFSNFIAILPRIQKKELSSKDYLQKVMERLRTIATPLSASQTEREYTSVTYLQFGDGYFGRCSQETNEIAQICSVGFASSLHLERTDLKVRVIDLPTTVDLKLLGKRIISEIERPEAYLAVGYNSELTRIVPRPLVQDTTQYKARSISWLPNDVFLVTGGAKGITAECALAFAKTTGVRMALVGSSPHPRENLNSKSSEEIANTLKQYNSEALTCRYYQCDVTNAEEVKVLIKKVQKDLGNVTGVIHGAALNKPRRVENSTLEQALNEVAPKVLGIINLCEALEDNPPKMFVGFSSISAVLGLPGNTWYGFSNEALDLILRRFGEKHPETSVLAIAFSVWAEVGMGARMGTVRNLSRMGIEAMPTEEGVRRFLQLMDTDPGDSQVIISARLGGIDTLRRGFDTWRTKRIPPVAELRFLENIQIMEPGVEIVARTHLNLEKDSYVKDHIYRGSYLFPTVFGLEAMAQAVSYATGKKSLPQICIRDIRLERPIVVDPGRGVEIEIRAEVLERQSEESAWEVSAEIRTEQSGFSIPHFAATFVLENSEQSTTPKKPVELPTDPLNIEPKQDLYGWLLFQGERFQRLQQIYSLDSKKMVFLAKMERNNFAKNNSSLSLDRAENPFIIGDPYCRDTLLQSVQPVVPQDICLPVNIGELKIYRSNSNKLESCIGVVILHGREGRHYNSTVFSLDRAGNVLEKLENYKLRILEHHEEYPTAEELADPVQRDEQLLKKELENRARTFEMNEPEVSLSYLPNMHNLSKEERHEKEIPGLSKAVGKLLESSS